MTRADDSTSVPAHEGSACAPGCPTVMSHRKSGEGASRFCALHPRHREAFAAVRWISAESEFPDSLEPVHAEYVPDAHACGISADTQCQGVFEVAGETSEVADVSFVDALG